MTREIAEVIAEEVRRSNPVVSLEEEQVWVSGMNARPWVLGREIKSKLVAAGFHAEGPSHDGAEEHGGLLIYVPRCEPISDEVHEEVFGDGE